jgi:molybdate transport system substrate-binding protein
MSTLRVLLAGVLLCAGLSSAFAADLVVFAAASLKDALDVQARRFENAAGHRVVIAYAGSNTLAKQIDAGAPADVFISADLEWMDFLEQRGLVATGTRVDLLRNVLVLIAPAGSTSRLRIAPRFGLASALAKERLAMANPDSVPAGRYGRSALQALGVWADVERQVARADNVRAALALVARGETPLGIVYRTDAIADGRVSVVDVFPATTHPPIVYPAAVVSPATSPAKASAAKALLDYLASPAARDVWERHGFVVAQ